MAVGLAGLLAGVLGLVQAHVTTPFGRVAEGCTLEVPHGTLVEEAADGVALYHPAHGSWQHRTPAHCGALASPSPHAAASNGSAPITCTSLPCNNWIDNAGWQQPDGATPIGGFSSKYIVPATPRTRGPGQTLFYFIGAENTDGQPRHGQPPPSGRAILQPVLTFDPDGWCKDSTTGWCFASWYCCPKNLTVHSAYVNDVKPWDSFHTYFNISEDGATYTVSGTSARTAQAASLLCPRQGRQMNWADVTLEVYAMSSCDLFSPSSMTFSDVILWDTAYRALTPMWTLSPGSPCAGSITVDPEAHGSVHIEHSTATSIE